MPGRQAEHLPCGVNLHRFRLLRCTLDFCFGSRAAEAGRLMAQPVYPQLQKYPVRSTHLRFVPTGDIGHNERGRLLRRPYLSRLPSRPFFLNKRLMLIRFAISGLSLSVESRPATIASPMPMTKLKMGTKSSD